MLPTYVAVGFKVAEDKSIFYFKEENLDHFIETLRRKIVLRKPDFVSLRMVKDHDVS